MSFVSQSWFAPVAIGAISVRLHYQPLKLAMARPADTLQRANLATADIDIVLCTGGSSLIPAVRRILDERFPHQVVEHDPFTSVAAGLAIANFNGW